jgi:hypothetical protein
MKSVLFSLTLFVAILMVIITFYFDKIFVFGVFAISIYLGFLLGIIKGFKLIEQAITELEHLQKKEVAMKPRVSIVYDNDGKHARANCSVCGAMVYQTCGLYPLKVALGGERPYCQHCGQNLSDDIDLDENHYCNCV